MFRKVRDIIKKILFKIKLRDMDRRYYFTFGNCFSLFPPSFYYTHTPEEIERIKAEEIAKIRKLLEEDDEEMKEAALLPVKEQ